MAQHALLSQKNNHPNCIRIPKVGKLNRAAIYVGPPLSGKDSQTEAYEPFGIPILKMGPTLKQLAANGPHTEVSNDIRNNKLVDSSHVNWVAKKWITQQMGHPLIKLNGCPRKKDQLPLINFLRKRGFEPFVIWFRTSVHALMSRPVRPGREMEDTPEDRARRIQIYEHDTVPMLECFGEYNIAESYGNLLFVDNSTIQKHEAGKIILDFLQLPFRIHQLFPQAFPELSSDEAAVHVGA